MDKEKMYYIQNGYIGNAMCWWGLWEIDKPQPKNLLNPTEILKNSLKT
jgi:hypothetical protein